MSTPGGNGSGDATGRSTAIPSPSIAFKGDVGPTDTQRAEKQTVNKTVLP